MKTNSAPTCPEPGRRTNGGGYDSISRREMLRRAGGGLGWLALAAMLQPRGLVGAAAPTSLHPLAARRSHDRPRAKSVIWIFANGGPSQVDTFDYKPQLAKRDGQKLEGFDNKTG